MEITLFGKARDISRLNCMQFGHNLSLNTRFNYLLVSLTLFIFLQNDSFNIDPLLLLMYTLVTRLTSTDVTNLLVIAQVAGKLVRG